MGRYVLVCYLRTLIFNVHKYISNNYLILFNVNEQAELEKPSNREDLASISGNIKDEIREVASTILEVMC